MEAHLLHRQRTFLAGARSRAATVPIGRARELRVLERLLRGVPERGGALVLDGPPGIGKSFLLEHVMRMAVERHSVVLTATGVESEADLPFAGLHQLLLPLLDGAETLARPQREALCVAFGAAEGRAPELFLIALATLNLVCDDAAGRTKVLLVDDAHWLDRASADVLTFVARRIHSDPLALLLAKRDGYGSHFEAAGLPSLELGPLDADESRELLAAHAPDLTPAATRRVLAAAAGNPLALVELPRVCSVARSSGTWDDDPLRLTARLRRAFADRLIGLPPETMGVLLIAALDESRAISEVLSAAARLLDRELTLDAVAPAIVRQLVQVDDDGLQFRHPLVRTAVRLTATFVQRQAAHAALASVLADQPDRRAWHLAAAAIGPDETVAGELEAMADRAQARGALAVAAGALERAAVLSPRSRARGNRLIRAAELASELGQCDTAGRLVLEAGALELDPVGQARRVVVRELSEPLIGDPTAVLLLVDLAEQMGRRGPVDLALKLLWIAATRAYLADLAPDVGRRILAACEELRVADHDPLLLSTLARAAPVDRGAVVIDRALRGVPGSDQDPDALLLRAAALSAVGAHVLADGLLTAATVRLREQGRLRPLSQMLVLCGMSQFLIGGWDSASTGTAEAATLARETQQPIWEASACAIQAMIAGVRGAHGDAQTMLAHAEQLAQRLGARRVMVTVQVARGFDALSSGHHDVAYEELRRLFDPVDLSCHGTEAGWVIGILAEAAVHCDRREEARSLMHGIEPLLDRTPAPWAHVSMRHARALLADDDQAEPLFEAGLAADLTRWPFDRARLQLAYGAWLRRRRRSVDSRAPLRAARDTFDALGATPWGERARQELRASGETSRRYSPDLRDELSPQELQIAQLAASGLSNREIGQRLYLSHRTVGSHLYRVFPKLGITSRADLSAALAGDRSSL